jgi:hypothetical protein
MLNDGVLSAVILSSNGKLATWQLVLFSSLFCFTALTGVLSFVQGLRMYRDYRITRDTPPTKVSSLAPGLVKVRGKAECSQPVLAPFSHTPCCFYKTKIEVYNKKGALDDDRYTYGWRELRKDSGGQPFFLADETGRVLVDAPKMFDGDLDARRTFEAVVDQRSLPLSEYREKLGDGDHAAIEKALQAATVLNNDSDDEERSAATSGKPAFRLHEWAVVPGDEYLAIGTYGENSESPSAAGLAIGQRKGMPFGMSHKVEKSDYDWGEMLRTQARSTVLVGIFVFLGGTLFLVPIIRYILNNQQ